MRTFIIIISLLFSGCSLTQVQIRAEYHGDHGEKVEVMTSCDIKPYKNQ